MLRLLIVLLTFAFYSPQSHAADPPVPSSDFALGPKQSLNLSSLLESKRVQAEPHLAVSTDSHDPNLNSILRWNRIAIDATGLDHTPLQPGETRTYGEQLGPGRAARAMAIVHIAMFEALNALTGEYASYLGLRKMDPGSSVQAAVAQAAHDTLIAMFPSQRASFNAALVEDLRTIRNIRARLGGMMVGASAARAILNKRRGDGADHAEPEMGVDFIPSLAAGKWRQDPISLVPVAMGAYWGHVEPFVLASGDQFRALPPPAMESEEYARAYEEVLRLGGDGITTPHERTEDQTFAAVYWAYDGTPSLCAPPRLYNQLAMTIARQKDIDALETGRLLALVNVAMADAAIAIWESKFYYQFWRPITGIREADVGMGPSGSGDGNPLTIADPTFMPFGAPASNLVGPNFTPPFPTYPSGHAGFGGSVFQVLRRFFGTDDIAFTFVSDEFNGQTVDHTGETRPLRPRSFTSFSQAEEENGRSRIYLGIHWSFDSSEGITQGQRVADYVLDRLYRPVE